MKEQEHNYDETKKYDEIRVMASKNWLSAASVSLAKLDEVKAKVYNMGLADPLSLKPTAGNKPSSKGEQNISSRTTSTRWAGAEPPLSKVTMQNNAWCTTSALPPSAPRVRQQCEQQKSRQRPESAKNQQKGAGVKLKRRPHSAVIRVPGSGTTEADCPAFSDVLIQDELEEGQSLLGVHGAKFDPSQRPDHFSVHQASVGYVAGGSGGSVVGSSRHDGRSTTATEQVVHNSQGVTGEALMDSDRQQVIRIPGEEFETGLPPAPCTSPDLTPHLNGDLVHSDDEGGFAVHVNIPQAADDGDFYDPWANPADTKIGASNGHLNNTRKGNEVNGGSNRCEDNAEVMTQLPGDSPPDNTNNQLHDEDVNAHFVGDYMGAERDRTGFQETPDSEEYTEDLTSSRKMFSDAADKFEFSALSQELNNEVRVLKEELKRNNITDDSSDLDKKPRPKSGKNMVQFDEKNNMTIKITPREKSDETKRGADAWPKPYSGDRCRTNSGIKLSSTYARINSAQSRRAESEQVIGGECERKTSEVKRRPQSAKVPTVSVNYLEDSDSEDDRSKIKVKKIGKVFKARGSSDIETLISKIGIEGDKDDLSKNIDLKVKGNYDHGEGKIDDDLNERPLSRMGSPTKCISSPQKNYYQLAIKTTPGAKPCKKSEFVESEGGEEDEIGWERTEEVKKTVKTLELLDGRELKEMKVISTIGTQEHRVKDYVPPRPASASRIKTAQKPDSGDRPASRAYQKVTTGVSQKLPQQPRQTRVNSRPQSGIKRTTQLQKNPNKAHSNKMEKKLYGQTEEMKENEFDHGGINEEITSVGKQEVNDTQEVHGRAGFGYLESERPDSRLGFRAGDAIVGRQISTEEKTSRSLQKRKVGSAAAIHATERHLAVSRETNSSAVKPRPLSVQLSIEKEPVSTGCSHHKMAELKPPSAERPRKSSVTDILAQANNFKGCGNLTANKLDAKKGGSKKEPPPRGLVEIWTRKDDFELDTDGMKECREIQEQLIDNGVPVTLYALKRALLPPTEYNWKGPSYKSNVTPIHPQYHTSAGLLTKPETWLPEEHQKVKDAQRKVRVATEILAEQAREERRLEYASSLQKKRQGGKKKRVAKRK